MSTPTRKKSWQTSRRRVSVLAEMALRKERIAERLAELRGLRGFSQEQAAGFVGITVRQWQRWEAGESVPYPRNLDTIASRFGISVAEFFDGDGAAAVGVAVLAERMDALEARLDALHEALGRLVDQLQVEEATRQPASQPQPATAPRRTGKRNGGTGPAG